MFFILQNFPTWLCWLTVTIGFIAFFASYLPQGKPFDFILKNLGVLVICFGIFVFGVQYSENHWRQKLANLQEKVHQAEQRADYVNKELAATLEAKTKTIKEIVYVNKTTIEKIAGSQINATCTLPVSSIVLHNAASRAEVAAGPGSTNGSPSGVAPSKLLETVVENYGSCHDNIAKLKAWQQWYSEQKKIFEEIK